MTCSPSDRASAVTKLDEGLEETPALHRLAVVQELGDSLEATNCLEILSALAGQRTHKVDRRCTSDQKQQWLAAALLDLRRIRGVRALSLLRQVLLAEVPGREGIPTIHAA